MNRFVLQVATLLFSTGIVIPTSFAAQAPHGGVAWSLPGRVEAENYDMGREGVAYHDLTSGNAGVVYRRDVVDVGSSIGGGATWVGRIRGNGRNIRSLSPLRAVIPYPFPLHLRRSGKQALSPAVSRSTPSVLRMITRAGAPHDRAVNAFMRYQASR